MAVQSDSDFVPILTVMVDYGMAPFLWLVDRPGYQGLGANVADGCFWNEDGFMSEGLWDKFALWAISFEKTSFHSPRVVDDSWDWLAFHARGLHLSRWLKEEVGPRYRVIYEKPCEDPNSAIEQRREIMRDGSIRVLPNQPTPVVHNRAGALHIVSGGQTGVDRAALEFAICEGYTHGGWAPKGRLAENGSIPLRYQLTELPEGGYRQRTRRNVQDSDATLIINQGALDGGTAATVEFATQARKPLHIAQIGEAELESVAQEVVDWLADVAPATLNIAGPREGKRPGIYASAIQLLEQVHLLRKN